MEKKSCLIAISASRRKESISFQSKIEPNLERLHGTDDLYFLGFTKSVFLEVMGRF